MRERKFKREIRKLQIEYERLTAENIYLLMKTETLTLKIADLEGEKESKKKLKIKPNTSGKKKKPGRKPGFKGTSRKIPDHVDEVVEIILPVCPECGTPLVNFILFFRNTCVSRLRAYSKQIQIEEHSCK